MNAMQHIHTLRETYVSALRRAIAKAKDDGKFLAAEVVIRADGGVSSADHPEAAASHTNEPSFLTVDLLTGTAEAPQPVLLLRDPSEGPLVGAIQQGNIEVAIFPFLWESCRVWLRHPDPDWTPVENWFRRWFEQRLAADPGEDGLKSMVHLLTEPVPEGGGYLFQVDFGSAPVEAFTELCQALSDMGATEVRVGHSDGVDMDPLIADELRSPTLTQDRFLQIVADLLRELEGITSVEILEPAPHMVLNIHEASTSEPTTSNLGNLWLVLQRAAPEQRPREVARYLRLQLESPQYRNNKPDLAALRPVIKAASFIEHVRTLGGKPGEKRIELLCSRLVGDLWVVCVWDRPNGMQFVNASEPEEFGLSAEEAYARALNNYRASRGKVDVSLDRGIILARTHDNYDASLLLDNAFWDDMAQRFPGTLLVCAPTRDAVLITTAESTEGGEAALRALAEEYLQTGNHAISTTVLRRQQNLWQVQPPAETTPPTVNDPAPSPATRTTSAGDFESRAAAPPPPSPRPPTPPAAEPKRPWWKFW